MRIRDLSRPLYEFLWDTVSVEKWAAKEPVKVHKNPERNELKKLAGEYQTMRGFLVKDGLIVWGLSPIHDPMARALGIGKTAIPLIVFTDGQDMEVQVSDWAEKTIWLHNPETANAIRNNPYMRKMFPNVQISYYDEGVNGDWEEM